MSQLRFLLVLALAVLVGPALAEKPSKDQEQIRRLRQQMQQIQQAQQAEAQTHQQALQKISEEKTALDEQARKSSGEAAGLRRRLSESERKLADTAKQLDEVTRQRDLLNEKLAALQSRSDEISTQLRDTSGKLRIRDADAKSLQAELSKELDGRKMCEAKNMALYQHGRDLLAKYDGRGVWSSLMRIEPLTGMKRVEIENVLEEYRDKFDAQRISANTKPASSSVSGAGGE